MALEDELNLFASLPSFCNSFNIPFRLLRARRFISLNSVNSVIQPQELENSIASEVELSSMILMLG